MKIIIFGAKGQLGQDCVEVLEGENEICGFDLPDLDITDRSRIEGLIGEIRPDMVLNCAAYTRVDACESDRDAAWGANVEGPRNLAMCIERYGGKLIHISTDYVFDGRKELPEPYTEEDKPSPVSYYGETKYRGEVAIQEITGHHIIMRTSWLYGINGGNFLKTILRLASRDKKGSLKVVNDQFGSPTWSYRLAIQIKRMIHTDAEGIYHATSEGFCSWFELAGYFLERMGLPNSILPCTSEEYLTPARRPKNSILENRRLKEAGINLFPLWQEDIDRFVERYRSCLFKGLEE